MYYYYLTLPNKYDIILFLLLNTSKIIFVNSSFNAFRISNCKISEIFFKETINSIENVDGEIFFESCEIDKIEFKSKAINCSLKFNSGTIKNLVLISSNVNKSISLDKAVSICNLFFESSNFYDRVDFCECIISENTYFHKLSFYEQVVFNKEYNSESLDFKNVYSKQDISIHYNDNIDNILISDSRFDANFSCYCYVKDRNGDSNGCSCSISGVIYGNVVFNGVPLISLSIGAVNFGNLYFNQVRTKLIYIQDFQNYNKLTISNIELDKSYNLLLIYDSNISDTEFVNINFGKFDEVVIAKSNVSGLVLSNSLFPVKIQTETKAPMLGFKIEKHEKINDDIYYRETYRQLKMAMEKQGNRNMSLRYKSEEMHYLRKELSFGWDKILLTLNYMSNNHGISWVRGIGFTVVVAFIFFSIYNSTLPEPHFYWNLKSSFEQTKEAFNIGLNEFSKFIASFPKLRLDDNSNSWKTNLAVLLSRIFIGYGIYQTITSFRKYGGR